MTADGFKYKRPFSPEADMAEQLQPWATPDMTADVYPQTEQTNALNKAPPPFKRDVKIVEEEITVKPLTADDMEQIRQAAYDEGFAEGKDEGFSKGYAEGREQGLQDGLVQGQAEGRRQGLDQGQQELQQQLDQLAVLLSGLQNPLARLDSQVEQSILALSLAMAKAVINIEVKTNPQVILQAVQEATSALPLQTEHMVIKLHPDDVLRVQQFYGQEQLASRGWQLHSEPGIEQGGCVVESTASSVDRSLNQRVQASLEHFLHLENTEPSVLVSATPTETTVATTAEHSPTEEQ